MMTTTKVLLSALVLAAVSMLVAFAVRGMNVTTVAVPSQNQLVCMHNGGMTLLYQNFKYEGMTDGGVIRAVTPQGYTLYYKMHAGEQCGYHPRVTINPQPGFPGEPIGE